MSDVFRLPGFLRFWVAETVSEFGGYITTVALQVLVVLTLAGTAFDVGLVNGARWLPYLLLGVVVGAIVDRRRRKPVMVWTDLARAGLLATIPLLWMLGALTLVNLMVVVALVGACSLLNDAASQSFVPRLVPRERLLDAHSRTDQASAVAQAGGPVVAGALVGLVTAPIAVLVDAVTFLISGLLVATVRVDEPAPSSSGRPRLRTEIGDGLRWVYRHRMLAPLAISTHTWFLANAVATTVLVPFLLLELELSPFELGLVLSAAGAAALAGAVAAPRLGRRLGAGPVIIGSRALMPLAWAGIALVPASAPLPVVIALLAVAQAVIGFAMGAENANEMGYRQVVTPDHLQARMNTTMRSVNRAAIVVGAPLGGLLADAIGYRQGLWIAVAVFAATAVGLALTPFRGARHDD